MQRWKQSLGWITLALLFGGVGLSIFSAFLGADRSKLLFASGPMFVLWLLFFLVLVAGLVFFPSLRRCPGLLGLHLGPLLILIGGLVNSERGHCWFYPETVRWSYLPLRVGQTAAETRESSLRRGVGELPFQVRLDAFEVERYPPDDPDPVLKYGLLSHDPMTHRTEWQARALAGWEAGPVDLPGTPLRMTVRSMGGEDAEHSFAEIDVAMGDLRRSHRLVCEPGERFGRVALSTLFPEAEGLPPGASLFLLVPEPPVRQYRSTLTFIDGDDEVSAQAWVNRPVRFGGYHFYQYAWGEEPELHTILLVVSRAGTPVYFSGLVLVVFGTVWRFWVRPGFRERKKRGAACT